ncbi:MAG: quinate 5-dehydrogenase, partial [Chloroflexi bacterium]|nr:quinate 5-dehydrogenase [Chloroflexota bacterium]
MKRAVSVSLGSSTRDKKVIVNFKGQQISVERIGTNGDIEKAKQLYTELDSQVEA